MTLEIIIGIIAALVVLYFVFRKDSKNDPYEPTLKADKVAAEESVKDLSDIALAQKADPAPKKSTKKKAAKVDLDSMKKGELLAHAKANGIKANASMNKAELIEKIKNG